jgi:urease accessory protein
MELRLGSLAILAFAAVAAPALAHPGHGGSGFLHPFTGVDHMLAMVGVGMWAWLLSARVRPAAFLVPGAFLAMMAIGAAAGFAGIKLPLVEAAILASVFLLGGLVMAAVRLPLASAMSVVGLFAFFHGYAHAAEAPAASPGGYMLAFLAATAVLNAAGLGAGWLAQRLVGEAGLRALGGLVMAGGALVLVAQ